MIVALLMVAASALTAQAMRPVEVRLDSIFAAWNSDTSAGCVLGVAQNGNTVIERAWGSADLERRVALTPASILEAGSVSKQFTAAAVLLLARDGKLSLDDEIHRWLPELRDYGAPVKLRQMLHHTSGMRDWGSIAGIEGWPRNTRALDHAYVLAITRRLRELNFPPGSEYDYSNTNYNLLAMVVERASGKPFPTFTRERIFVPLGMTHSSWRDDATRLVKGRALSYSLLDGAWHSERAIESIYGNCCLLTTVGDLLKWNAAFDSTRLGGTGFREEQERQGVLTGGRRISYAAGLFVTDYRGEPVVMHDGATAGYRAFVARFPRARLAVAMLCNAGNVDPADLGYAAAAQFLPPPAPTAPAATPVRRTVPPAAIADKAGLYRNLRSMIAQRFVVTNGKLMTESGTELVPQSPTVFVAAAGGNRVLFDRRTDGHYDLRLVTPAGDTVRADWVEESDTNRQAVAGFFGSYSSDEANTTVEVRPDSTGRGGLILHRDPDIHTALRPVYRDGFRSPFGMFVFARNAAGQVTEMRFTTGRVRNLRFVRR
jgi:CubicO group peptidase (beta-lactamase class C family)